MSEISKTTITSEAWTEITLPANALNLVMQAHHTDREVRVWFGSGAAPTGFDEPSLRIRRENEPLTFSIEDGDAVYARIYAATLRSGRVDLWA